MSVESLIFLAIFFLLPLIERLLERNRRKRHPIPPPAPPRPNADGSDDPILPPLPRPRPPVEPVPQRPAPPPSRPIPPPLPVPAETRRPDAGPRPVPAPHKRPQPKPQYVPRPKGPQPMPDEVVQAVRARERALAQAQRTAAANVASTRVPRAKTRTLNRILRNPRSLRQAILAAEVLGPCKAQAPRR